MQTSCSGTSLGAVEGSGQLPRTAGRGAAMPSFVNRSIVHLRFYVQPSTAGRQIRSAPNGRQDTTLEFWDR
eukprot:8191597-Pyramimonas_sp.AAC.1